MSVKFTDNSDEILQAVEEAALLALTMCGLTAEEYAKKLCPVKTGNLRNSISHTVDMDEHAAYVGTNSTYGVYVEMGTGKYAEGGGGRQDTWAYQDAKGDWHWTHGQRPQPFIKPAVADHAQQYSDIIKKTMENA